MTSRCSVSASPKCRSQSLWTARAIPQPPETSRSPAAVIPSGREWTARKSAVQATTRQITPSAAPLQPGGAAVSPSVRTSPPTYQAGYTSSGSVNSCRTSQAISTAPEAPSTRNAVTPAPRPGRVGSRSYRSSDRLRPAVPVTTSARQAARVTKVPIRARVRSSSPKRSPVQDEPMVQTPGSRRTNVTSPVTTRVDAATEERSAAARARRWTTSRTGSACRVAGSSSGRPSV